MDRTISKAVVRTKGRTSTDGTTPTPGEAALWRSAGTTDFSIGHWSPLSGASLMLWRPQGNLGTGRCRTAAAGDGVRRARGYHSRGSRLVATSQLHRAEPVLSGRTEAVGIRFSPAAICGGPVPEEYMPRFHSGVTRSRSPLCWLAAWSYWRPRSTPNQAKSDANWARRVPTSTKPPSRQKCVAERHRLIKSRPGTRSD